MVSKKSDLKVIPIARPYLCKEEEGEALEVIRSGWIAQGAKVEEFEAKIAEYTGAKYAIATSSGTTALYLALLVLGIGKGDGVIVPSFSFIATANTILYCEAEPVFIDIDSKTYNIDPQKIQEYIEKECKFDVRKGLLFDLKTGASVRAIMAVHQFGLPSDMDRIFKIARNYNLAVLEDAACALGSRYKNRMIGTISEMACFSFHPRKVLTTGEGGMIVTDNKVYAKKAMALRNHGIGKHLQKYDFLGYNYRLTDIQAGIGLAQILKLSDFLKKRKEIAAYYDAALKNVCNIKSPYMPAYAVSNYQSYVVKIEKPLLFSIADLVKKMIKKGISVKKGNAAIHLQPFYKKRRIFKLPETEHAELSTIALPIFYQMTQKEQRYVIDNLLSLTRK